MRLCRNLLLLATSVFLGGPLSVLATERLNVLMIVVDDLRPQLGCYGDKLVRSPNIDSLAARGVVFDRAYCQQASCSPSRLAVLSGLRPSTTGIYSIGPTLRSRAPDVITLPQLFKNNGYITRSLGKVYHKGIDDSLSWSVPSWHSMKPRYGPEGEATVSAARTAQKAAGESEFEQGQGKSFYAGPAFEAPDVADKDLLDGDTAREAVAAIHELAQKLEPFFLAVGFANPHVPWVAPRQYWDLYDGESLPLPKNDFVPKDAPDFATFNNSRFYWHSNVPEDRKITPEFGRRCLHGYLAAISYVDALVGWLLEALEETGLDENTIVVLWGDHGYYMGEHGWWGSKQNNYEGATHAPLIVALPSQKPQGGHTRALVEFMDIYPTLAGLCDLPVPETVEGTSFVPLLADSDLRWKKAALSQYPKQKYLGTAMRTDRYRYIQWTNKRGEVVAVELYDHEQDPQENQNIAASADKALLDDLAAQLRAGWKAARP